MTAALATPVRRYGAYELKQNYQGSLLRALLIAVVLHLAAFGAARWFAHWSHTQPLPAPPTLWSTEITIDQRRVIIKPDEPFTGGPGTAPPIHDKLGIPVPVPDIEVVVENALLRRANRLVKLVHVDRTGEPGFHRSNQR